MFIKYVSGNVRYLEYEGHCFIFDHIFFLLLLLLFFVFLFRRCCCLIMYVTLLPNGIIFQ